MYCEVSEVRDTLQAVATITLPCARSAKSAASFACQARAEGNVTIVIPPWNAVFGKKVYGNVEDLELEPATTSAKNLRDTIASAGGAE